MRVLFLGNHDVGLRVLQVLARRVELVGVVAHPPDPEDGVRYASVHAWAQERNIPVIRASGKDAKLADFIVARAPDLLCVADYRYLLPARVVELARLGAVNFHPSLLPRYRGRASINWAILHGETQLGLTLHWIDDRADTGDIIMQESYRLGAEEDVGDALAHLLPLYESMTERLCQYLKSGSIPRRSQPPSLESPWPKRTPADGLVAWSQTRVEVRNLIRAVARPYPGAFTYWETSKVMLWKTPTHSERGVMLAPGEYRRQGAVLLVGCADGVLTVSEWETESASQLPAAGHFRSNHDCAEVASVVS